MEHLATLERLRQSQRQDYLKVISFNSTLRYLNRQFPEQNPSFDT